MVTNSLPEPRRLDPRTGVRECPRQRRDRPSLTNRRPDAVDIVVVFERLEKFAGVSALLVG